MALAACISTNKCAMYFEKKSFQNKQKQKRGENVWPLKFMIIFSLTEIFDAVSRVFTHKQI